MSTITEVKEAGQAPTIITQTPTGATTVTKAAVERKQCNTIPWPAVIFAILALFGMVFIASREGVNSTRRVGTVIASLLWSILWFLLMILFWRHCYYALSWALFVIVIILNFAFLWASVGARWGQQITTP